MEPRDDSGCFRSDPVEPFSECGRQHFGERLLCSSYGCNRSNRIWSHYFQLENCHIRYRPSVPTKRITPAACSLRSDGCVGKTGREKPNVSCCCVLRRLVGFSYRGDPCLCCRVWDPGRSDSDGQARAEIG